MKELPADLATMDAADLDKQSTVREEVISPLFRRWPNLSRVETSRLRVLYAEQLRIAKYLGKLRGRRHAQPPQ